MRIHAAKTAALAGEMLKPLLDAGHIEAESPREVQADIEAVISQYVRDEQAVTDRARDLLAARNLPSGELGRIKKLVADERKLKIGDEAIDYLLDQLVEMLMHSANVDEVFAPDHVLRLAMREPLRRASAQDAELDAEVRGQLKHVQEGTSLWEVEYRRMMEDAKRRKGL